MEEQTSRLKAKMLAGATALVAGAALTTGFAATPVVNAATSDATQVVNRASDSKVSANTSDDQENNQTGDQASDANSASSSSQSDDQSGDPSTDANGQANASSNAKSDSASDDKNTQNAGNLPQTGDHGLTATAAATAVAGLVTAAGMGVYVAKKKNRTV